MFGRLSACERHAKRPPHDAHTDTDTDTDTDLHTDRQTDTHTKPKLISRVGSANE